MMDSAKILRYKSLYPGRIIILYKVGFTEEKDQGYVIYIMKCVMKFLTSKACENVLSYFCCVPGLVRHVSPKISLVNLSIGMAHNTLVKLVNTISNKMPTKLTFK